MYVFAGGAVEISRERRQGALQIRRTARRVIPLIANLVSARWIKRQRVAVAIERAAQRHPRIDAVVERAFDDVGILRFTGSLHLAPLPHLVPNIHAPSPLPPCF